MTLQDQLIEAAKDLALKAGKLQFKVPIAYVYHPLDYAWKPHEIYLRRFGGSRKEVIFLGMNPGPFGMAQTGVPFGEIAVVRDWMGIQAPVARPEHEHPRRPVLGFACPRSEISGRRLWGLFAERFGAAENFFASHFVVNYCPLAFLEESGRNATPDKLPSIEREQLEGVCNTHLRRVLEILQSAWIVGVGDFAKRRAADVAEGLSVKVGQILHPSPASPAANRDWAGKATSQLKELGVWK